MKSSKIMSGLLLLIFFTASFSHCEDYFDANQAYGRPIAQDINNDGFVDMVVGSVDAPLVFLNKGDGKFNNLFTDNLGIYFGNAKVVDINGYNFEDIIDYGTRHVYKSYWVNSIFVLYNNRERAFKNYLNIDIDNYPVKVVVSDINGDSSPDILYGFDVFESP